MEFEIDVSGEDIFDKDYTIVVAERNNSKDKEPIIFGYKLKEETIKILKSRYGQELYRYGKSKSQLSLFKVRIYSVIIFYLFNHIYKKNPKLNKEIILNLCRDFQGKENIIKSNLNYLLKQRLGLDITIHFCPLQKGSIADKYAYLMRNDKRNLMKDNYVTITSDEFNFFLKK